MNATNIYNLLHPTISEAEVSRKDAITKHISAKAEEMPLLKHFLQYSGVTADFIASCVMDASYLSDFMYNRCTLFSEEELPAFGDLISQLEKTV